MIEMSRFYREGKTNKQTDKQTSSLVLFMYSIRDEEKDEGV